MSNQTFVKKDRISFAQNLNETIVIAPSNITTNALYIGPNSAITYDGDSNVASINYLQGVTLSNQYIYADGTYLSNLPTGITTSNLVSTVVGLGTVGYISTATGGLTENDLISSITGLGTFGYISTQSLQSTVTGLGNIYLSTNTVPSTIVGLGTFGYLSTNTVPSTIVGLGTFGYLSTNTVPSTIVGLGTFGYLSTNTVPSTIVGLGTFGYISSTQLRSTVSGLGNLYISTFNGSTTFLSTAVGFISSLTVNSLTVGTGLGYVDFGAIRAVIVSSIQTNTGLLFASSLTGDGSQIYNLNAISSLSLQSTIVGLGTFGYLSTNTVPSTIVGLGTFGYISSLSLQSTVTGLGNIYFSTNTVPSTIVGLGTFGYLSSFNSISTNNISAGNLFANIVNTSTISNTDGIFTNSVSTGNLFANVINGSTINILDGISTTSLNTLLINSSTINNLTNICTTRLFTRNLTASDGNYISLGGLGLNSGLGANIGQIGFQFNNIIGSNVFTSNISAGTISTRNLGVSTLFFSVAQGYQISTNRIVGETRTNNLYPLTTGAIIGYGSLTGDLGFYNEGHFRSTFTQTIQPTLDNDSFSNIVRINGNISSQNTVTSSITTNILFGLSIDVSSITANGSNLFNLNAISSLSLNSTIEGLGTFGYLSTNTIPSTIVGLGTFGYLSTNTVPSTIVGLGTFGYLSTNTVPSTIEGLGTFGYISSTQLTSTVTGLGNIYLSTFTGSTNFISSAQGFISSLNVNSLTFASGNGWLDLTALRAILVSTIQLDAAVGNFSSISGNGSQIVALNAISSLSLQSTIQGLGTFGYLSTNTIPSTIVGLGTFGYLSTNTVPSTIVGLGTFGYVSSFNSISSLNISTGNLFTNSFTTNSVSTINISSASNYTSVQLAGSYNGITVGGNINMNGSVFPTTGGGVNRDLGSITNRWNNFFVSTISSIHITTSTLLVQTDINVSTINASTIGVHRLTGPNNGFNTFTNNLFPISQSATIGYNIGGTGGNGFYSNISVRSTYTQVIHPSGEAGIFSSTIYTIGNLSSQNTVTSSITTNILFARSNVSTNLITTNILGGSGPFGKLVYTDTLLPNGSVNIGNAPINSYQGGWFNTVYVNTIQANTNTGVGINSTVRVLGTLSTQNVNVSSLQSIILNASTILASTAVVALNINVSSITGNGSNLFNLNAISSLSLNSTIEGLGTFGYLSTNTVPSTIEGLGTFGYISSTQLTSTVTGLGNIYLSTFTGSTNFISSGQGFISSLNVNSLTFASGNGWLDLTALRAILVSTIQLDAGIGNFSSISGNGSQIVALNAISSLSLQSTIQGLGTFGYLSTNTVPSTIVGLGTFGYLSTNIVPSTIVGLGTFGYISSIQLTSTVIGLGNIYLSSGSATQVSINSTIEGLGTFGYISTTQLTSTVTGLGNIYLSTNTVPSTIVGLGTFGYISSLSLQSTVRTLESYYSIITLSTNANLSVSSLTFVETNTNSTTTLSYRSSMIYVGNNILYGALQYTPQFITF